MVERKTFFTVMIEAVASEQSFFQTFWTWANYPGEAIERVLRACGRLAIRNAIASDLDVFDYDSLPANVFQDKTLNVYYALERNAFPTEKTFIAPFGIIKAPQDGEYAYDQIREGFSLARTEAGIYEVEVAIERDKLFNTFVVLAKRLPSIKLFWIKLAADWEDQGLEELWTNEDLNTVESITNFLATNSEDTIANGHVAPTAYSKVGQTNLLIDTHKTIKVLTKSLAVQRKMATALRRLGFAELTEFHSLEYGYHHWHYRPTRSKSRKRLIAALKRDGFSFWQSRAVDSTD